MVLWLTEVDAIEVGMATKGSAAVSVVFVTSHLLWIRIILRWQSRAEMPIYIQLPVLGSSSARNLWAYLRLDVTTVPSASTMS